MSDTFADIPHPLPAARLKAICANLHDGKPHGALAYVATRLGIPYRSFVNYATGARQVPRHVTHSLRNLCALQQLTKDTEPMGIGNDGLRAEAERDRNAACADALREIERILAPCAVYGAPATCTAVNIARTALAAIDKATTLPTPVCDACPSCGETSPPGQVNTTWQQWQCACCGSWNTYPEAR